MEQFLPLYGIKTTMAYDESLRRLLKNNIARIFLFNFLNTIFETKSISLSYEDEFETYFLTEEKFLANFKTAFLKKHNLEDYFKENYKLYAATQDNLVFEIPLPQRYKEDFKYIMKGQYSKSPLFKEIYKKEKLAYWICEKEEILESYVKRLSIYLNCDILKVSNAIEGEIFYPPIERDWKIQL